MRSMTGFGEAYAENNGAYLSLKVSSVNSRHLEINFSLPSHPELERKVNQMIRNRIERGMIDVHIESNVLDQEEESYEIDRKTLLDYLERFKEYVEEFESLHPRISITDIVSLPGVLQVYSRPHDDKRISSLLVDCTREALDELIRMREREGEAMSQDLAGHKETIISKLQSIEERVPQMLRRHRKNVEEKIQSFLDLENPAMEERIENELKMYADKCDISEEVVRVKSHLQQFDEYLQKSGPVGKSLEFLLQEIQRETNTIGAKANDAEISQIAVDIKTELEKCREQVRNIE